MMINNKPKEKKNCNVKFGLKIESVVVLVEGGIGFKGEYLGDGFGIGFLSLFIVILYFDIINVLISIGFNSIF